MANFLEFHLNIVKYFLHLKIKIIATLFQLFDFPTRDYILPQLLVNAQKFYNLFKLVH